MDDDTPEAARARCRDLSDAMTAAELDLRRARDAEVDAKHVWEAARRAAYFSPQCPRPVRGGVTVGERDAWVDAAAAEEQTRYEVAQAWRQAAKDHHDTVRDQAMLAMSLLKSIDAAFTLALRYEP